MLFSKKIPPQCAYCKRGNQITSDTILCKKQGVTTPENSCSSFRYDPLKRTPTRPAISDFSHLKEEDFTL